MGGACKVLRFKVLVRLGPSALGVGSAGICLKGLELAVFRPAKIGLVEGLVLGYIQGGRQMVLYVVGFRPDMLGRVRK